MNIEFLIKKYNKLIYKICLDILKNTLDAQDITQEVYLNIFKNIDKYSNLEENEIKNIICKIALNKCKDFLKSKYAKSSLTNVENDDDMLSSIPDNVNIEEKLFKKEQKLYIHKMINELKPPYNEILYKYYIEEIPLDKLSKLLNISKPTLKVQIYRGKQMLKDKLGKEGNLV